MHSLRASLQDSLVLYICYKMNCECMYIITLNNLNSLATNYA